MYRNRGIFFLLLLCSLLVSGCSIGMQELIVNQHAEAFLTKNNELQFRFKINERILNEQQVYKVKVTIHNDRLASALGMDEIIYGGQTNYNGEYIEVRQDKENVIFMTPIPLLKDLHVFEIEEMIMNEEAVSIEVFNDEEVFAKAYLNNFSSQL
ncbi:hypothetical protein J2Z40_000488 [Cytobacillus eiseniae]|uniref:Lipoprotein n=1 Tax=Cytobacillus eiseniae TaxID=762947 RepID=A0ABS4RAM5_9BACI|nr:hypothetical protein [Cytobacillus eiseniae]MBP2239935.1 hypothetical protein [Cytobacillus eiseniae]